MALQVAFMSLMLLFLHTTLVQVLKFTARPGPSVMEITVYFKVPNTKLSAWIKISGKKVQKTASQEVSDT